MYDKSLYESLSSHFDTLPIVDTHEHLPKEQIRISKPLDFSTLFSHYCKDDLTTAGMTEEEHILFYAPDTDVEWKWQIFSRYYPYVKNTSYIRTAKLAMQKFYGVYELNSVSDAAEVTACMQKLNQPGLYDKVLRDACHLKTSLVFTFTSYEAFESDYFHFVDQVDHYCCLTSRRDTDIFGCEMGGKTDTLKQYTDTLEAFLRAKQQRGIKGIKFAIAYRRTLSVDSVDESEACRLYGLLPAERPAEPSPESKNLQDFLVAKVLAICEKLDMPVVFHTGLHAGNANTLTNSNPLLLTPLFQKFKKLRFVLLHCGLPWTDEAVVTSKYFPNVFLDMAWVHIISQEMACRTVSTFLDMVPTNKLLGFGGDYLVVEKVYGHLCLARENLCRALTEKVANRGISADDAHRFLEDCLCNNAARIYNLD